ncbi:uncharacterized protein EI90DRAFT_3254712 [Cantharellus anzutake]|uniref:uncharacterized protein n=1 Tax=Cantharellus anzutake TaxID=1750568 RepID=UPI0019044AC8|nr:uncharacterized protein EI90DRAFT_3254712 [Cantharellus anzutake]KAF8319522.1 hypothetical protein EI90DRAFT_3254712 [Cantharellus anzutake]
MTRLNQARLNLSVAIPIEEYSSVESSTESSNASCQESEPIDAASTSHEAEDATPVHSENEFLVPCDRAGEYSERLSTKESSVSVWDSSGESSASGYGEAKMCAEMPHSPEYNEGHGSPPKKDPDKALSCESDPNRGGEAPKHVRMPSLPTISEFNDGYAEPPTKDPDKALYMNKRPGDGLAREYESEETLGAECLREVEFQGDTFAVENPDGIYVVCDDMIPFFEVKHESKVTPEAESIRDAKLHSDILTLEMPEGTYIICDDEIALFEVNGESEPSRKSKVARVLDSAQEDSEHEHKEPRPPGLNDELNCCFLMSHSKFRGKTFMLETPEGIYVIHGGLVILFEVAQAAEREIQFRPSLAQDGTEFKAKSEPKSLSLSDELNSMPISVTLTRELNREQDYDLIDKDANIHDVFDAMNGPTSRNLVSAGPGNGAPQPPKTPRSPDLVDDGYECRPEKDPDKVSNMNKRPGNGPAREQESEETPEVKCLRGVESQGDTHILAMPEGIFSFQA